MKIGCHISIAGGIVNAPQRAADFGCEVFQMFTRSPQGGPAPKITPEVARQFKEEMEKWEQKRKKPSGLGGGLLLWWCCFFLSWYFFIFFFFLEKWVFIG